MMTGNQTETAGTTASDVLDDGSIADASEEGSFEVVDVELVVLDMAGTTVRDDGLVERAFELAAERSGIATTEEELDAALDYVLETMGQSKIDVFLAITGDQAKADAANQEFEKAYGELITAEGLDAIDGAEDTIRRLRDAGVAVVLTTGFSVKTREAILERLGWTDLVEAALSPSDAGRGRPYPDLPLTAVLRTGTSSVGAMVVVGDTTSDIASGVAAGAGLVIGVLTGAHDEVSLYASGADEVIESIADLPALLGVE